MRTSITAGYEHQATVGGTFTHHNTAIVEPGARIGPDSKIGPYAIIHGQATIGMNCIIEPYVEIEDATLEDGAILRNGSLVRTDAHIGSRVSVGFSSIIHAEAKVGPGARIQSNVSLPTGLEVGPLVFIGPCATFTNNRHPRGVGLWDVGRIILGYYATIGAGATVIAAKEGLRQVGEFAMVAANSIVTRDVPPFGLFVGKQTVGWVNALGDTISDDPKTIPSEVQLLRNLEIRLRTDPRMNEDQIQEILGAALQAAKKINSDRYND